MPLSITALRKRASPLATALRTKRLREHYSLRSLGGLLGISFSTLARIERGEGEPDIHSHHLLTAWLFPHDRLPPCHCTKCLGTSRRLGWECPRCHRCYAPTVERCPQCPATEAEDAHG